MSQRITKCPKCSGTKINTIDLEKKRTSKTTLVNLTGVCEECENEFTYPSLTEWGLKKGIRY